MAVHIAADEQQFGLHEQTRGGELHAPVMELRAAVALSVDDPAGAGGVAEAAVGRHPVEGRGGADALAVAHLVEPEVLRVLEESDERLFGRNGSARVGRAVAVLNPPGVPGRAFDQAVPGRHIEHGEVLELGIGREHPARGVEQAQVFDVAFAAKERAPELGFLSSRQWQGGDEQQDPSVEWSESIHRLVVCGCEFTNSTQGVVPAGSSHNASSSVPTPSGVRLVCGWRWLQCQGISNFARSSQVTSPVLVYRNAKAWAIEPPEKAKSQPTLPSSWRLCWPTTRRLTMTARKPMAFMTQEPGQASIIAGGLDSVIAARNQGGTVVGEICYIRARRQGGPRFDASLTAEQRDDFPNLILFCRTCHTLVDTTPDAYTAERLQAVKQTHERQTQETLSAERFWDLVNFLVNEKLAYTPVGRKHLREGRKLCRTFEEFRHGDRGRNMKLVPAAASSRSRHAVRGGMRLVEFREKSAVFFVARLPRITILRGIVKDSGIEGWAMRWRYLVIRP